MKWVVLILCLISFCAEGQYVIPARRKIPVAAAGGGGLTLVTTNNQVTTAGTTTVHSMGTLSANTFLVVTCANEDSPGGATFSVADSLGTTWTLRARGNATGSPGNVEIWSAFSSGGGADTVTATCSVTGKRRTTTCWQFTGSETTWGGAIVTNTLAEAAPSDAITTTRSGSIICGVISDFLSRSGTITYRTPPTHVEAQHDQNAALSSYHFGSQVTTATAYTMGMTAPSTQQAGVALIEVRTP